MADFPLYTFTALSLSDVQSNVQSIHFSGMQYLSGQCCLMQHKLLVSNVIFRQRCSIVQQCAAKCHKSRFYEYTPLEPIRKVWIHDEGFATSRFSMMRIMARRMKAATVLA